MYKELESEKCLRGTGVAFQDLPPRWGLLLTEIIFFFNFTTTSTAQDYSWFYARQKTFLLYYLPNPNKTNLK